MNPSNSQVNFRQQYMIGTFSSMNDKGVGKSDTKLGY